jgi:hypothetical protein
MSEFIKRWIAYVKPLILLASEVALFIWLQYTDPGRNLQAKEILLLTIELSIAASCGYLFYVHVVRKTNPGIVVTQSRVMYKRRVFARTAQQEYIEGRHQEHHNLSLHAGQNDAIGPHKTEIGKLFYRNMPDNGPVNDCMHGVVSLFEWRNKINTCDDSRKGKAIDRGTTRKTYIDNTWAKPSWCVRDINCELCIHYIPQSIVQCKEVERRFFTFDIL